MVEDSGITEGCSGLLVGCFEDFDGLVSRDGLLLI